MIAIILLYIVDYVLYNIATYYYAQIMLIKKNMKQ